MQRRPQWFLALSLVGSVAAAGCIGSIGSIGSVGGVAIPGGVNVNNGTAQQNGPSNPAPQPAEQASAQPAPGPAPLPQPAGVTFSGRVTDQAGVPVSGAHVVVRVVGDGRFLSGESTFETVAEGSTFSVPNAPAGAQLSLQASTSTASSPSVIIQPVVGGPPGSNIVTLVLSPLQANPTPTPEPAAPTPQPQGPLVTAAGPTPGATGWDPTAPMTLNFSKPMNSADVENNLAIFVAGAPGASYALSAGVSLPVAYDAGTDTATGAAALDQSAMVFTWSNNNQTLNLSFRPGYWLPSDRDPARVPSYGVTFRGPLRDAAGASHGSGWFQGGKNGFSFRVAADATAPRFLTITPVDKDSASGGTQDRIRVQFSKPMVLFLTNGIQIPAAGSSGFAFGASQFKYDAVYTSFSNTGPAPVQPATPQNVPTDARIFDADATRSTVLLSPVSGVSGNGAGFQPGDTVRVQIGPQVIDPAGNPVEPIPNMLKSGTAV